MTILCVHNGPYMLPPNKWNEKAFIRTKRRQIRWRSRTTWWAVQGGSSSWWITSSEEVKCLRQKCFWLNILCKELINATVFFKNTSVLILTKGNITIIIIIRVRNAVWEICYTAIFNFNTIIFTQNVFENMCWHLRSICQFCVLHSVVQMNVATLKY